jgi:hypothetical protein
LTGRRIQDLSTNCSPLEIHVTDVAFRAFIQMDGKCLSDVTRGGYDGLIVTDIEGDLKVAFPVGR